MIRQCRRQDPATGVWPGDLFEGEPARWCGEEFDDTEQSTICPHYYLPPAGVVNESEELAGVIPAGKAGNPWP